MDLALAPLKNKRWLYSVGTPQANLLAEVNQQTQSALLQALGIGLIALIVSLLGARWITRPIRRVVESANALASGDLSRRVGLDQRDEAGQLAAAFDVMAEALEQRDTALRKGAEQLETTNDRLKQALEKVGGKERIIIIIILLLLAVVILGVLYFVVIK